MFRIFSKESLDELKEKINSINKLSCLKGMDYKIHNELENVYEKLLEFSITQNNLSDIYLSFDNMRIWDILEHMDKDSLDLIVDIFDMIGRMMMGDLWDDDKLLSMSGLDSITEFLYCYHKAGRNKRKKIRNNCNKIIIFLKSCMIYEKINTVIKNT